jgi:two-component system, cell cycle sensor histidine kinase and response regulator CckA
LRDQDKTKQELLNELEEVRERLALYEAGPSAKPESRSCERALTITRRCEQQSPWHEKASYAPNTASLSLEDCLRLRQELHFHQIELEKQNDELRKAQQELVRMTDQYRELYDFTPVGYFILDKRGVILEANLTGATLLGVEKQFLIHKPFVTIVLKEARDTFHFYWKKVLEATAKQTCEMELVRKDGKFHAQLEAIEIRDRSGESTGLVSTVFWDITDRIEAEIRLERELKKFQALYDLALGMTSDRDLDETLLMAVEQTRNLLGVDAAYIALRDEKAGDVYMHTLSGIETDAFKRMRLQFGAGLGGKVAATGQRFVIRNYAQEVESPVHDVVSAEGLISGIAVPIQIRQTNLGVLYGFNRRETSFSKSDLDTLFLLGNLAAVEITRKKQEIELRQAHDDLEQRVQTRTAELSEANKHLKEEVGERKRVEAALRGSESMLRNILATSPVGIGLTENRIIKWSNESWMKMFGFEREEEFVGQTTEMLYASAEEFERVGTILYEGLQSGSVASTDATFKRKDGSRFDVHIRLKTLGASDFARGEIAAISDISDRKRAEQAIRKSEERYRALAENALTGICLHRDGLFIYANDRFAKDLGYSSDELVGKPVLDFTAPEDRDFLKQRQLDRMSGKEVPPQFQLRVITKNGNQKWFQIWSTVIEDEEGPVILSNVVDSTESKQAQRALQDSQQRLELALLGADLGLWDWNVQTGEAFHNRRWATMVGMQSPANAWNILLWKERVHPEDVPLVKDALNSHLEGKTPLYEVEYRFRNQAGGWTWILARGKVVERDNNGKSLRMTGTALDITNRKRAEEALKDSEKKFRLLYEKAPVGYQSLDEWGHLVEVNQAWLDLMGYSREEVIGTSFEDYLAPGFKEVFRHRCQIVKERGEVRGAQFEMIQKNGSDITVAIDGSFVTDEHGVGRSHCILHDITSRKRAEKEQRRLAAAIAQASEGIVITDDAGTIQYVNPAFERMTGFQQDEVIDTKISVLRSDEHEEGFYQNLHEILARGEAWKGRLTGKKKDGTTYQEDTTISPVFDDAGQIVNYVGVQRDVTEQIALEKQLLHAQKMEAVGTLAGGIAHDFNNLLTIVSGYTELLLAERSEEDPEYADLEKIGFAAQRGAELVRSLLAFSRKVESKLRPVNLNQSIEQVRKLLFRTIPKMIEIQLNLPPDVSVVSADPAQMEQVLINLAVNAKDAMPDGGKLIFETANIVLDEDYCKTHFVAKPGDYVLITVSDTGEGIDRETLDHIFEPFYSTKGLGKGTGLGLAMVYGIVQQHGGHITCYSEVDVGTTFRIYIPAMGPHVETRARAASEMPVSGTETILLVDDEEFVRDLGIRILERAGYTVLTAANGIEALNVYRMNREKVALVILDLIMPEMGGTQCLRELLKEDPNVKVIVASGFSVDGPAEETIRIGAKAFVSKPYRANQILQVIRRALDEK